jgi:hypothetical protein
MWQAEVRVDLDAIRDNVAMLRARTSADVLVAVKADGYGHGLVPAGRRSPVVPPGSASPPSTRRSRCAGRVSRRRSWPGC